jgi:hypothetical protein
MHMHPSPTLQTPRAIVLGLGLALTLSACDSGTDAGTSAAIRMTAGAVAGSSVETSAGLSIAGTNGTLLITDIKVIVNELELRRESIQDCDDDSSGPGDCGSFESRYFVADVPLGTGAVTIGSDRIPEGTYTAVEFEVKDLEVDAEDPDDASDAARIAAVLTQVRSTYADWPAGASMVIVGTFTPTGGVAQPFRAYFDAEVEVERFLNPPLVVDATSTGLTIDLRPDLWFKNPDGTVRNLALSNFATTGTLISFEVEFEDGCEVEIDD